MKGYDTTKNMAFHWSKKDGLSVHGINLGQPNVKAVANWLGDRWDEYTGKAQTQLANQQSKDLAAYSFDQEKQMVKEQNEYNSPKSQMQRYQEAGLNPHLIYQQGTPGNQTTIAKYNAPDIKAAPRIDYLGMVLQALSGYQSLMKTMADTENVKAHTNLLGIQGRSTEQQILDSIASMNQKNWETKKSQGLYEGQLELQKLDILKSDQELAKLLYEKDLRDQGVQPNDWIVYRLIAKFIDWVKKVPKNDWLHKSDYKNNFPINYR